MIYLTFIFRAGVLAGVSAIQHVFENFGNLDASCDAIADKVSSGCVLEIFIKVVTLVSGKMCIFHVLLNTHYFYYHEDQYMSSILHGVSDTVVGPITIETIPYYNKRISINRLFVTT